MAEAQRESRWEGFDAAHGYVRDGVASLRNLENLLKSPRIGPRALEKVVAELRPGCRPLGDAFTMLIDLVDARDSGPVAGDALRTFASDRIDRLERAIERAAKSDMGAKARLQLEAQIVQLGAELDALRGLVDLLDAATTFRPTELDLHALATEALGKLAPPSPKHPRRVGVVLVPAADCSTVVTDPRAMMPLLATALAWVASGGAKSVRMSARVDERQASVLSLRPMHNGQAANIACVPPRLIAPSVQVAHTAAALTGAQLVVHEGEREVDVSIPPGQVSETVVKSDARPS